MVLSEIGAQLKELEAAELEAQDGVVNPQIYTQLLAIYLYQNELYFRVPLVSNDCISRAYCSMDTRAGTKPLSAPCSTRFGRADTVIKGQGNPEKCYAKYLWKRIPPSVKNSSAELQQIWTVGQRMWQRDWPAVHTALNAEWSEDIAEIMNGLKETVRERAMLLVSDAYSSLDIAVLAGMTGLPLEQAHQTATERGWTVDGSMIQPCKVDKENSTPLLESLTQDQLYKLTQFVSFLEN